MTLKEKMQQQRDNEMVKVEKEEVKAAVNKIRRRFRKKQRRDRKECEFNLYMYWDGDTLILQNFEYWRNEKNKKERLASGMVISDLRDKFMSRLTERLEKEGIRVSPYSEHADWLLTMKMA